MDWLSFFCHFSLSLRILFISDEISKELAAPKTKSQQMKISTPYKILPSNPLFLTSYSLNAGGSRFGL